VKLKAYAVLIALAVVLAGPFLLRPADTTVPVHYDRRLVIMTPHHEKIRYEFGRAFVKHWKEKTGETLFIDWRTPGGTSEIAMFLKSEYAGAFQYYWEQKLHKPWDHTVATAFANAKAGEGLDDPAQADQAKSARSGFLASEAGIGVDLLFGGGTYDFQKQANAGFLVAASGPEKAGLTALKTEHPEWFTEQAIPEEFSGEPFRDPELRWVGAALSGFGIVYNEDSIKRIGITPAPSQWQDLGDPKLAGQIALADPTKSGSVAKAFELIIQQQMQQAAAGSSDPQAIARGWEEGLKLIQRISANSRYFTDSASKIALEVAQGDAAAGMSIDFYGRSTEEQVRRPDGGSRVHFVMPAGGTSIGVDPIGMLRGAPEPKVAQAFMEFVLSDAGQKLWAFKPGTPGGPEQSALRRLPVRRDFYTEANRGHMADANEQPYDNTKDFTYHPEWTGQLFDAIRFIIRVMCVDTHREQQHAWRALIEAGFPPDATAKFHELQGVNYETAMHKIAPVLRAREKVKEVQLARELGEQFRRQYQAALRLAEQRR
jgi:ABC-type Fe3+ transport system substrate-binding protein